MGPVAAEGRERQKNNNLAVLESRVAELEQCTRINDIIVTGLVLKPQSDAKAVVPENNEEPSEQDSNSVEQQLKKNSGQQRNKT